MRTPQWVKKLGGHAGEMLVCGELSKRGIPNAPLPENFSDDDILIGNKEGTKVGFIQVKSCHPDRSESFILRETHEKWVSAPENQFCILVWLGKTDISEPPRYWVAFKREVGQLCIAHGAHGTDNWERRFFPKELQKSVPLPSEWENRWTLFDEYVPQRKSQGVSK